MESSSRKFRSSYLNSISNPKQKTIQLKYNPNINLQKASSQSVALSIEDKEHIKIQEHQNSLIHSSDISFNLDKLYFNDFDESEEKKQNLKIEHKQEKQITNQSNTNFIIYQVEKVDDLKKHQDILSVQIKPPVKAQTPEQYLYQLHQTHYDENLNRTLSIDNLKGQQQKSCKDQDIQVNFEDFDTFQESQFSMKEQFTNELDRMFVDAQYALRFNAENPLLVKIEEVARLYPLDLSLYHFVKLNPLQNKAIDLKLFEAFMIDWKKSQQRVSRKCLTLAKIRTTIIRDAMNCLVDQRVPPNQQEEYHIRIGKKYRSRYIESGVPTPPPRVNNLYLQTLFSDPKIKAYYKNYVEERLQIFLQEQNYRRIEIYSLTINELYHLGKNKTVGDLVRILQTKKKPFTNKQIKIIMGQASKIGVQYGNFKKRIGNGQSVYKKIKKEHISKIIDQFNHMVSKQKKRDKKQKVIKQKKQQKVKKQYEEQKQYNEQKQKQCNEQGFKQSNIMRILNEYEKNEQRFKRFVCDENKLRQQLEQDYGY